MVTAREQKRHARSPNRHGAGLALALVFSATFSAWGCANMATPESARGATPGATRASGPKPTSVAPSVGPIQATEPSAWIGYRRLAREDFQSSQPPAFAKANRGHLAAATCAILAPGPTLRFRAVRPPGAKEFTADAVDLAFAARMDPSCSWWDTRSTRPDDYILEHEQVHFAIVELVARDLNRHRSEIERRLRSTGPTGEVALRDIQQRLTAELEAAARRVHERSRRFDEETSLGYFPDRQRSWKRRIESELSETADWAASASANP